MAQEITYYTRTAQSGGLTHRAAEPELVDVVNALTMRLRRRAQNSGGLAIGSSDPAKIKLASTINFLIDGAFVALTTAEYAVPAAAAMAATAGDKSVWCAVSTVDGANVVVTVGVVALLGATAVKPAVPDNAALIGWVKIAASANNIFTPGTTALSGTGITDTYVDAAFDDTEIPRLVATQ